MAAFAEFYEDIIYPSDKHTGFQFLFAAHTSNEFVENGRLTLCGLLVLRNNFSNNLQGSNFPVTHVGNQIINGLKPEMGPDLLHFLGFNQGVKIQLRFAKGLVKHLPAQGHTALFFLGLDPVPDL